MSYIDDFWKALKKKEKQTDDISVTSPYSGGSVLNSRLSSGSNDDIAPVRQSSGSDDFTSDFFEELKRIEGEEEQKKREAEAERKKEELAKPLGLDKSDSKSEEQSDSKSEEQSVSDLRQERFQNLIYKYENDDLDKLYKEVEDIKAAKDQYYKMLPHFTGGTSYADTQVMMFNKLYGTPDEADALIAQKEAHIKAVERYRQNKKEQTKPGTSAGLTYHFDTSDPYIGTGTPVGYHRSETHPDRLIRDDNEDGDFFSWFSNVVLTGLNNFNKGLTSTADTIIGKPLQELGWENNPISKADNYYEGLYDKYKTELDVDSEQLGGGGWMVAAEIGEATVAAVPDALIALMTAGGSTAATTGKLATEAAYQGGNVLTKAGLTAEKMMENPQFWLSFARTYGSDYEEAVASGANPAIAALSATTTSLVNAGIEIGITGGSGMQGLPDALKGGGNVATTLAISAAQEGSEEVLQSAVNDIVARVLYDEDRTLSSPEEMLKEFGMGASVGFLLGGGQTAAVGLQNSIAQSKKENALSTNEKKVVDKVVQDRIAEQEKDGNKLTSREKTAIENQVRSELEKGDIPTDTIEEVLGGETYKSYKDTIDSEESLRKEYEELGNLKESDMTAIQKKRFNELDQQLAELKNTDTRSQLKTKLSDEVFDMVQGSRLSESYNQKALRGKAFEADLSQYDEKQRVVVQSAIDSGILNNTRRTHELVDLVAKLSADKGVLFDFTNNAKLKESGFSINGKTVNGFVNDGKITINTQSSKYINSVVGHEVTHVLEGTALYNELQKAVFQYAQTKGDYQGRLDTLTELYKDIEGADINAELTADLVGDYLFTDSDFINRLSTEHRNVFQKIYDEIKYLYKVATAGSKEARQLEQVKKAFDKAYKAGGEVSTDTKYSLSETSDGRLVAVVDNDILSNIDTNLWDDAKKAEAKKAAAEALRKFSDGVVVDGITRKVNRVSRREYTRSEYTESLYNNAPDVFADKMRAADVADDIVVAATNWIRDGGLKHQRNDNFVDFDHGETLILSGNSKYIAEVVVGITNNGEAVLYDIVDITPTTFDIKKDESPTTATTQNAIGDIQGDSSADNVAQESPVVKGRFSLSADSEGKQLTQQQQEFFKDSKAVDESGNLVVLYHGTKNGGFTVFDPSMSDDENSLFFTNDPATASTYAVDSISEVTDTPDSVPLPKSKPKALRPFERNATKGKGKSGAYKVYLNLTNPLVVEANGANWNNIPFNGYNPVKVTANVSGETINVSIERAGTDSPQTVTFTKTDIENGNFQAYFANEFNDRMAGFIQNRAEQQIKKGDGQYPLRSFGWDADNKKAATYGTRSIAQLAKEQGYDGVIFKSLYDSNLSNDRSGKAPDIYIAFNSNQVKDVNNTEPTADKDIRYSLSEDSQGREIPAETQERLQYSVIRDESGRIKPMYHGSPNGNITSFNAGTYFTDNKEYADRYQNTGASSISTGKVAANPKTYEVYLDIRKPFDLNDAEARNIYINEYIKGGNALGINPYMSDADYAKIAAIDWTEGEDLRDFLIENGYEYDGLVLDEGADGGYGEDVKYRGKSYMIFDPEQVVNVAPDVRFSLSEYTEEEKKAHNKAVVDHFGTTYRWAETGYVLLDGSKLDLSGKHEGAPGGYRTVDHRDIVDALGSDYGDDTYSGSLVQFMSEGNIRISPESNGINLSVKPNKAQEMALSSFISNARGEVMLDIDDFNGYTVVSVEYPWGTHANKVLNDIRAWFENGTKPEVPNISRFRSLSSPGDTPTRYGNYAVSGKDIALETAQEELAPAEDVAPVQETAQETAAPVQEDILLDDYAPMAEDEADFQDRLSSLDDADAPPEMERTYDEAADVTPLTQKIVKDIAKELRNKLALSNKQMAEVHNLIREYGSSEFPSREQLYQEIKNRFGTYTENYQDDVIKDAKAMLRSYRINVSDSIKGEIPDYGQLMRSNFGKVRFSKEGVPVDVAYLDLSAQFPHLFPEDVSNPTDELLRIIDVANMDATQEYSLDMDSESIWEATDAIAKGIKEYRQQQKEKSADRFTRESFDNLVRNADEYAPAAEEDIAPVAVVNSAVQESTAAEVAPAIETPSETVNADQPIKTVKERLAAKLENLQTELANNQKLRNESKVDFDNEIARLQAEYDAKKNKNTIAANDILRRIERAQRVKNNVDTDYAKRINDLQDRVSKVNEELRTGESTAEQGAMRRELHTRILEGIKSKFSENGFDFDEVLKNAKDLSTFATVDNTPQRVMEKALGYKEGQVLSDITVNQVAQNETKGIKWLNSFTGKKSGLLAQISKQYNIKPGSKESAAAQMYAEGFYVDKANNIIQYGDNELAQDFPDATVRNNIKGLARDTRIRQIYDDTLAAINESRARNAYPEIKKLDNYFLHFRAMDDTFSRLGLPFNPNDIRAKDLPTDLNGVTADLKPGQPYFSSAMHRQGKRTSFDLLGGLEKYLTSAKDQIYHIDDIQTLRALRNYIADTYGQAKGLEDLDLLTEEEVQEKIEKVYGSHLSTFAKFLNEEANVIAGKTALIDRGLEGIIGRRGITFLNSVNRQVGANMVGYNISSSMTNFIAAAQGFAKTNKSDFVKGFAQTVSNRIKSITGNGDGFAEQSPVMIRRKGADRFHRTAWQKMSDPGYALMGAVDSISTELIARTKYSELTKKGMDSQQAHIETDKWVSRLMGDRSLGQQPQLYNSKMLGLLTKFQLEVRNQLDSQFYDTIQEAKVSNEEIENKLRRNAKTAAKVTATFAQLAVAQHLFGKAFESVAGYNPAFDIVSVLATLCGFDDEEESEDTALDNVEQAFFELMGDMPYVSTLTGGRIPISSALPIEELFNGEDQYGNEKSRWETLAEAAPYYLLPGGYGQARKTYQGLSMFDEDHPVAGSYTDSGNLRFPVEDTLGNRVQAGLFGQWSSENARDYFDNERKPLEEKQIQEYIDVDIPIRDYWEYREGLSGLESMEEKAAYIDSLDLPTDKKNLLINNLLDRKEPIDMQDYGNYSGFAEFDFAEKNPEKYDFFTKNGISYNDYATADEDMKRTYTWAYDNPEKYNFLKENGVSLEDYSGFSDDAKNAYTWAYNNPEKHTLSKAVASDVVTYRQYATELYDIKADKDENGKSISGSRKEKVVDYINNLDADYGEKIILFKSEYPADDTYNYEIVDYLNSRDDISYSEMVTILKELGFTVDSAGNVFWD